MAAKVALASPGATMTEGGTLSAVTSLDSETVAPAVVEIATVQVELPFESRLVGLQVRPVNVSGGTREIRAVCELPFRVAVTLAVWLLVTVPTVAMKVVVRPPAATVTEAGMIRAGLLADKITATPPLGAPEEIVTVQVELAPEAKLAGEHCRLEIVGAGGVTVTTAAPEVALSPAVMVTAWLLLTGPAWALNVAVLAPEKTVTDAGTVRAGLLADRVTAIPLPDAAAEIVTVQVEFAPEITVVGAHCKPEMVGAGGVTVTTEVPEVAFSPAVMVTD